jgi:hypothetical protein
MIELKKEINELSQRLGEAARYPLEFEPPGKDSAVEPHSSRGINPTES